MAAHESAKRSRRSRLYRTPPYCTEACPVPGAGPLWLGLDPPWTLPCPLPPPWAWALGLQESEKAAALQLAALRQQHEADVASLQKQ